MCNNNYIIIAFSVLKKSDLITDGGFCCQVIVGHLCWELSGWKQYVCVCMCAGALSAAVGWHHLCNGTPTQRKTTERHPQLLQSQAVIGIIRPGYSCKSQPAGRWQFSSHGTSYNHTPSVSHMLKKWGLVIVDSRVHRCCCEMEWSQVHLKCSRV